MACPYEYALASAWDKQTEECEWHEGMPKQFCPECEAAYEEWCELQGDMDREERAFRDN